MATIYVREERGGSGMTRLEAALIFEALAMGCPCVVSVIDRFGSPPLRARYLPKLATMELLSSYCLTEPGAATPLGAEAAQLCQMFAAAGRAGDDFSGVMKFLRGMAPEANSE